MNLSHRYRLFVSITLILLPGLLLAACGKPDATGNSVDGGMTWYTIHIFPDHGGWAITSRGILHTIDNGGTWQIVTPAALRTPKNFAPTNSYFWDSQGAWFVSQGGTQYIQYGQKQKPDLARVYHSADGGRTWQSGDIPDTASTYSDIRSGPGFILNSFKQFLPLGEDRRVIGIHHISSTDPQHAWIAVSCVNWHTGGGHEDISLIYLRVWQTSDGGQNWHKIWETTDKNYPPNIASWAYFMNPTTGLMNSAQPTTVLFSNTGGQHWQEKTLPAQGLTAQDLAVSSLGPPSFFDATHGVISISKYETDQHIRIFPFVTSDGGQNWQAVAPLKLLPATGSYTSDQITYLDRQHWIATGKGMLSHSDDGGAHWQEWKLSSDFVTINSLSFVTNQEGWGIGLEPAQDTQSPYPSYLVHTSDGGKTWVKMQYKLS